MENRQNLKSQAFTDYMYDHEKYFASIQEMKHADRNPKFKLDYWNKNQDKIVDSYVEYYEIDKSAYNE